MFLFILNVDGAYTKETLDPTLELYSIYMSGKTMQTLAIPK